MIEIKKDREPAKLLWYRQQTGASYEQMDKEVKDELLEKLLQEQGHICAYCMRRIPETRALPTGVAPATIEHWLPRNPKSKEDIGQGMNYRNMFAVCSGNRGCGNVAGMTCDASRGNSPLKVNPCDAATLRGITYTSSGRIQSSDPEIDDVKRHGTGNISLYCKRKLEQIKGKEDPRLPFVGIMIWWLSKHV